MKSGGLKYGDLGGHSVRPLHSVRLCYGAVLYEATWGAALGRCVLDSVESNQLHTLHHPTFQTCSFSLTISDECFVRISYTVPAPFYLNTKSVEEAPHYVILYILGGSTR
jgi:hypothetical protein